MTEVEKFCVDRVLPRELISGYSTGRPWLPRAILVKNKMWPNGSKLRVSFIGGTPEQRSMVEQAARQWMQYANLQLDFGDDKDAEVRVGFMEGDGSWSAVGTDCKDVSLFPKHERTVNFGWLDEGTILHEFGHAIGLGHEHQSPFGGIQWNEPAVIQALQGSPNFWPPDVTRHNVIRKYSFDQVIGTKFDPDSIMLYFFPASWTTNGVATHANEKLSRIDKKFIAGASAYPKGKSQDDLLVELKLGAKKATSASIGKAGEEDLYVFHVKSSGHYVVETQGPTDLVMRLYGPDDRKHLLDEDDDGGQAFNARIARSLEPGEYLVQVRHYNRKRGKGEYSIQAKKA